MVGVNATRGGMAQKVTDATEDARLIGFDREGHACVWFGGYSFNVYDVAGGWSEVRSFTSGDLAGMTARERRADGEAAALRRMETEGFHVVR